jgi:hypothetical protein
MRSVARHIKYCWVSTFTEPPVNPYQKDELAQPRHIHERILSASCGLSLQLPSPFFLSFFVSLIFRPYLLRVLQNNGRHLPLCSERTPRLPLARTSFTLMSYFRCLFDAVTNNIKLKEFFNITFLHSEL